MRRRLLFAFCLICFGTSIIRADKPLPPPQQHQVESPSKKYVATIDPIKGVMVRATDTGETLWKAPNIWSRSALLADDGDHLVTGYDGLGLIPLDYTADLVLITFWHRHQKVREITVGNLFPDPKLLVRTVSHYHWGNLEGIRDGKLTVRRCDNKSLSFDVRSGKQTN